MGMEQRVDLVSFPPWAEVATLLAQRGCPVQMRMIDGELALPEETPPENWRELRVGTAGGMITVRRDGNAIVIVTWGNADAAMRQAAATLAETFADAGRGS